MGKTLIPADWFGDRNYKGGLETGLHSGQLLLFSGRPYLFPFNNEWDILQKS
jgi:hypothetical protein